MACGKVIAFKNEKNAISNILLLDKYRKKMYKKTIAKIQYITAFLIYFIRLSLLNSSYRNRI
jgi:hypothetical protein